MYAKCIQQRTQLPFVVIISASNKREKPIRQSAIIDYDNTSKSKSNGNSSNNVHSDNGSSSNSEILSKVNDKVADDNNSGFYQRQARIITIT